MITGRTELVGLLGWPVAQSLSPAMHNAAFAALGMDWAYLPLPAPPATFSEALRGLTALGFRGANVTIPHKQAALRLADEASAEATLVGAANTLLCDRGRLIAHNTDVAGFLAALAEAGSRPRRAVVLGAGGAARAVCVALTRLGADVLIANRSARRARSLAAELSASGAGIAVCPLERDALAGALGEADTLVNATSAGMWPNVDSSPLPEGLTLPAGLTVVDLVYNPLETPLLRQARAACSRCLDGLAMLVHQGAASFELWTGNPAPIGIMRAAALAALQVSARSVAPETVTPEVPCSDS